MLKLEIPKPAGGIFRRLFLPIMFSLFSFTVFSLRVGRQRVHPGLLLSLLYSIALIVSNNKKI